MTLTTLLAIGLLCLAFDSTRWVGVLGFGLLFYFNPLILFGLVSLLAIGLLLRLYYRGKSL
ncbi:MAG: hypothetical protein KJ725_13500 [Gammaproteobacteria bacterium]|nr:hypothetical protein [Gammaproteobacteria bacterium]